METKAEEKTLVGLTGADLDFIAKAKAFTKELHREVYRCVSIICELNAIGEFLAEDDKDELNGLRENWARWHAENLKPDAPTET
jgi:hypothetical protein